MNLPLLNKWRSNFLKTVKRIIDRKEINEGTLSVLIDSIQLIGIVKISHITLYRWLSGLMNPLGLWVSAIYHLSSTDRGRLINRRSLIVAIVRTNHLFSDILEFSSHFFLSFLIIFSLLHFSLRCLIFILHEMSGVCLCYSIPNPFLYMH